MVNLKKSKQFIPEGSRGSTLKGEGSEIQKPMKKKANQKGNQEALREHANERNIINVHFINFVVTVEALIYQNVKRKWGEKNKEKAAITARFFVYLKIKQVSKSFKTH